MKELIKKIEDLKKRVAALEGQVQAQPKEQTIKTIKCQNCEALLASITDKSSYIHLDRKSINYDDKNLITLTCQCGCITQYKDRTSS